MALLVAHLPHLVAALLAPLVLGRLEWTGPRHRTGPAGAAALAAVVAGTAWLAIAVAQGDHADRAASLAFLAASALGAVRAGALAGRGRLPGPLGARMGTGGRVALGVAVALVVGAAETWAGVLMTHGHLLAAAGLP
jgi:hypothetical protein